MTVSQINTVLTAARLGSISAAAAELNISQPNASSSIRAVEKELGVTIFRRGSNGIVLTDEGYRFLSHADKLIEEYNSIYNLKSDELPFRFHLGIVNYSPFVESFISICAEHSSMSNSELSYMSMPIMAGITMLSDNKIDAFACVIAGNIETQTEKAAEYSNLRLIYIDDVAVTVKIRADHPIIKSGVADDYSKLVTELQHYPYVEYSPFSTLNEIYQNKIIPGLKYKYLISVDERESRGRILAETDAFAVGAVSTEEFARTHNLRQLIVPNVFGRVCIIVRKGEEERREISEYVTKVRHEMEKLKAESEWLSSASAKN